MLMIPLLSSAVLCAFMCAMVKITSEHAQKDIPRLNGWREDVLTKLIFFCTLTGLFFILSHNLICP